MSLIMDNGSAVKYRGALRSAVPSTGSTARNTVNVVPIEYYVRGVIAAEMPSSWMPEALKAQSVAARTYGVRSITTSRYYDICSTTACQVYGGASRETASHDAAAKATTGKIVMYDGKPAFTQFSSSSGGYTAPGSQPYLKACHRPVGQLVGQRQPRVDRDRHRGEDREGIPDDRDAQAAQDRHPQRQRRLGRPGQHDQPGGLAQDRHDLG